MKQHIPLTIVIFAAVTGAVALRAADRRPAVTADLPDFAGHGRVIPPGTPGGGPDNSVEQMKYVFHELHADGRHALCAVCGSQDRPPVEMVTSDLSRRTR